GPPGLRRALDRSRHRLLEGSGHQGHRPDGRLRQAVNQLETHCELVAAYSVYASAVRRCAAARGCQGRSAERQRTTVSADGAEPGCQPRVSSCAHADLQWREGAERLHRARVASLPGEGQVATLTGRKTAGEARSRRMARERTAFWPASQQAYQMRPLPREA